MPSLYKFLINFLKQVLHFILTPHTFIDKLIKYAVNVSVVVFIACLCEIQGRVSCRVMVM